jgi:hypothetical protein
MFALQICLQHLVIKVVSAAGKESQLTQHSLHVFSGISIRTVTTIKQAVTVAFSPLHHNQFSISKLRIEYHSVESANLNM